MTRERYKEMQMNTLQTMRSEVETHRMNPVLQPFVREELERKYQSILQKQVEWEQKGFWTDENEKRFQAIYKRLN